MAYRGSEIIKGRCGSHAAGITEGEESVGLESGVAHGNGKGVYLECGRVAFFECTAVVSMYRDSLRTKTCQSFMGARCAASTYGSGLDGSGGDGDGSDPVSFGAGCPRVD